jgi:hypothetical protein
MTLSPKVGNDENLNFEGAGAGIGLSLFGEHYKPSLDRYSW